MIFPRPRDLGQAFAKEGKNMNVREVPNALFRKLGRNFRTDNIGQHVADTDDERIVLILRGTPGGEYSALWLTSRPEEGQAFGIVEKDYFPPIGVTAILTDTRRWAYGKGCRYEESLSLTMKELRPSNPAASPVTAALVAEYVALCQPGNLLAEGYWEVERFPDGNYTHPPH